MAAAGEAPAADWHSTGERLDALLAACASHGPAVRERGEELVRLVTDFYGAGLERLLELLHERGRLDEGALAALAGDELVAGMLLVHGLHPWDVATRVEQALEGVRPYLGSHGGDVELVRVTEEGAVTLRLLGSCDGCPSSSVTLTLAVRGAVEAAAPEVTSVEVVAPERGPAAGAAPVVPVDSLFTRLHEGAAAGSTWGAGGVTGAGGTWRPAPELAVLEPGGLVRFTADGGLPVVGCRVGGDLFAFRDGCARCGQPFEGAALARRLGGAADDAVLRCPSCHAHYDVRHAGRCLDDGPEEAASAGAGAASGGWHLDPLPLLADGAAVSLAVPAVVPAAVAT